MSTILTTRQYIQSWLERGLITAEVADALHADLGPESAPAPASGATSTATGRINAGLEALGYLGSALIIGAAFYLFDIVSWPQAAVAGLLYLVAAGSVVGVKEFTPATTGPMRRLATVIGVAGVCSLGSALALTFASDCLPRYDVSCSWGSERAVPLMIAVVTTGAAVALYKRAANAATHLLMGTGVGTVTWLASLSFFPPNSDSFRAEAVVSAMAMLPVAVAWIWASETNVLKPSWAGTVGASIVALVSTITLADVDLFGTNHLPAFATVAFGGAYIITGTMFDRWRLTAIGAVVLLFSLPWLMTDVLGLSSTTTAVILLPVGIAMLAFVLQRTRNPS